MKSTLVAALRVFHDVESSRILIDDQRDLGDFSNSLRNNIGMVTQDTSLLHRSIKDNILYGRPEATDEEVYAQPSKRTRMSLSKPNRPVGSIGYDAKWASVVLSFLVVSANVWRFHVYFWKNAPLLVLDGSDFSSRFREWDLQSKRLNWANGR